MAKNKIIEKKKKRKEVTDDRFGTYKITVGEKTIEITNCYPDIYDRAVCFHRKSKNSRYGEVCVLVLSDWDRIERIEK